MNFKEIINSDKKGKYESGLITTEITDTAIVITDKVNKDRIVTGKGAEFKRVQEPVDFMTAVKSKKLIRCDIDKEYIDNCRIEEAAEMLKKYHPVCIVISSISLLKNENVRDIILNGKWYIEED